MPHNTSVFHKYSFTMPNSTQKLNIPQYTIVHSIIQSIKILDKYNIFIIYTIFPYYLQSYATKNNSLYKIPIQYLQYTITINIRQYFYTIQKPYNTILMLYSYDTKYLTTIQIIQILREMLRNIAKYFHTLINDLPYSTIYSTYILYYASQYSHTI